jgi:hypothetical protein
MKYGRIDLTKTNYKLDSNASILLNPNIEVLNTIYTNYCEYKKFSSVEPLFKYEIINSDIIGYFDQSNLVAFSIISHLDEMSVRGVQFAWDYKNPSLQLGWKANYHECAWYKQLGYKYYYLGSHHPYKENISGYEILGPLAM